MSQRPAKTRNGWLTAFLVVAMFMNALTAGIYLLRPDQVRATYPAVTNTVSTGLACVAVFNFVCTVALLRWKRWGFWGVVAASTVALVINLSIGIGIGQSLFGVLGPALLFAALQIGKDNKGWPQLE